ncbi:hypothetical protein [unidentified bacterial endosymbiont]|uniref:hypothetical protein n=1 Tax=unidentified bacterial endosymbiont TaxID=2355 RepID=UPI0020A0722D|nr:hypothetical protein [unidentified bacterial endosymbiont]
MATWQDIPEMIFLAPKMSDVKEHNSFNVQISFLSGKVIKCNTEAWLLLVKLPTPAKELIFRWVNCCGVLLAANEGWHYGVMQRNDAWWLVQRFTDQYPVSALRRKVHEQIAVATLLGRRLQKQLQNVMKNDKQLNSFYMAKNGLV